MSSTSYSNSIPRTAEAERALPVAASATIVAAIALLGLYVRLVHVLPADFPLNDGGLFYRMIEELRQNGYALPAFTSYNAAGIPYAYPPLSFYLAGGLADLTGWRLIDIVRLLPPVLSALAIPAFYILARSILHRVTPALIASLVFALLPQNLGWYIMGGGLPRSLALVFALLALHQVHAMYTTGERKYIATSALLSGLTVLSHPQVATFLALSIALFFVFFGRSVRALLHSALVLAGVLLVSAPWWGTVLVNHGPGPLLAALQSGRHSLSALYQIMLFQVTGEPFLSLFSVLCLLGIIVSLVQREWLLPVWLLLPILLTPRTGTDYATVPLAMLAAVALDRLVLPQIAVLAQNARRKNGTQEVAPGGTWVQSKAAVYVLAFLALYGLIAAYMTPRQENSPLVALGANERSAMDWIASNTPADSRFLVMSGRDSGTDSAGEWFPVVANRVSLSTAQGYEWMPINWVARAERANALQYCVALDGTCLDRWATTGNVDYTHVYVRTGGDDACCSGLYRSLKNSADYRLVYEQQDVAVFSHSTSK
jgi:hypothetical protein